MEKTFLIFQVNSENVLLGDLGVMTYFTNITPYDYNGLGTSEITQLLYEHNFTNDTLAEVIALHNISIAVTYDNINPDIPIPCNWILIGYFYYPTNVLNGADHLNIYAINPAIALELQMNLKSFSYHLSPETSMLYIM